MREYEISIDDTVLGKAKVYKENITHDLKSSLMESNSGYTFNNVYEDSQTYEVMFKVDNVDDLYDIVSKYVYDSNKVFEEIDEIKKYNDIKSIKKDTNLKLVVPEIYLSKLNISKNNIDYNSLLNSKVYFIKGVIPTLNNNEILNSLNDVIIEYNNYIKANEYEFLTDEEKREIVGEYLKRLDKLIEFIEKNTKYKYGKNYVVPIKISNN